MATSGRSCEAREVQKMQSRGVSTSAHGTVHCAMRRMKSNQWLGGGPDQGAQSCRNSRPPRPARPEPAPSPTPLPAGTPPPLSRREDREKIRLLAGLGAVFLLLCLLVDLFPFPFCTNYSDDPGFKDKSIQYAIPCMVYAHALCCRIIALPVVGHSFRDASQ